MGYDRVHSSSWYKPWYSYKYVTPWTKLTKLNAFISYTNQTYKALSVANYNLRLIIFSLGFLSHSFWFTGAESPLCYRYDSREPRERDRSGQHFGCDKPTASKLSKFSWHPDEIKRWFGCGLRIASSWIQRHGLASFLIQRVFADDLDVPYRIAFIFCFTF